MAGKARRAAARQGQLNRKRKKSQRGPTGIPTGVDVVEQPETPNTAVALGAGAVPVASDQSMSPDAVTSGVAQAVAEPVAAPAQRPSPVARIPRAATSPQGGGRVRGERPAAYNFVGAELRRISILSAAVIAALVVLGILL